MQSPSQPTDDIRHSHILVACTELLGLCERGDGVHGFIYLGQSFRRDCQSSSLIQKDRRESIFCSERITLKKTSQKYNLAVINSSVTCTQQSYISLL
jgi:hypothetical protein